MGSSSSAATGRHDNALAEILVPLREQGDKPPLFHIPAGYGDMRFFGRVAEGLDEGRPVYGLQPPGQESVRGVRVKSLDWLISEYIQQIKRVQKNGPYHLSGYSGGGLLAVETAKTLIAARDTVAFLAVLDPPLQVPPWLTLFYMSLYKLCRLTPLTDRIRWRIIRRFGQSAFALGFGRGHVHAHVDFPGSRGQVLSRPPDLSSTREIVDTTAEPDPDRQILAQGRPGRNGSLLDARYPSQHVAARTGGIRQRHSERLPLAQRKPPFRKLFWARTGSFCSG